ncbi:cupin domain-containing protein [Streptomyces sp. 110]|uniref:Cupin domain-containing protein n=1 Tax=Streptomyces endocoffeicus TaxID=2898945 RepID=A0ABS1Q0H4_9ACTN|nr:cupin domain-containing protein [Streptomyces endocoffeicus]MBL1118186.1 cupin domain-containing protein [Streptomyces endocoffeicus]
MADRPTQGPAGDFTTDTALGARIREYRMVRRMSLRALAEAAPVSPGFLSQLERGQANASIGTLRRIAGALGITVAHLFDQDSAPGPRVTRRADRPMLHAAPGSRKTLISHPPFRHVEVYAGEFDPGASTGDDAYTHGDSQEILLVISGAVRLELDGRAHDLEAGDSIEYRTSVPHRVANIHDTAAEILWIISPPTPA